MVRALIGDILSGIDGAAKQGLYSVESQLCDHSTQNWICFDKKKKIKKYQLQEKLFILKNERKSSHISTVEVKDGKKLPDSNSA